MAAIPRTTARDRMFGGRTSAKPRAAPSSSSSSRESNVIIKDNKEHRRFHKGRFLGKGGFAKCYELTDVESGEVFAGKIVSKKTLTKHRALEKLNTEIKIHKSLNHPHVVGFHRFFEDESNVYILLELCSNKSLMELHRRRRALTEPEVRFYLSQIMSATEYMHEHKVIHRDLKLGNLFLNENLEIKVGDFGLATQLEHDGERKKTLCGTPNYIAPEILENKNGHSYEVDVWSIGCILYTMLIGRPPFETSDIKETYWKIKCNDYRIPSTSRISEEARDLIAATLSGDPSRRPSLEQIKQHPFLSKCFVPTSLPLSSLSLPPSFGSSSSKSFKAGTRKPLRTMNDKPGQTHTASAKPAEAMRPRVATIAAAAYEGGRHSKVREAREALQNIRKHLISVTGKHQTAASSAAPRPLAADEVSRACWISKWVDYSNKYGLGYQLSNSSVGVLFNDSTKMVLAADQRHIESVDRDSRGAAVTLCTLDSYPDTLSKKVILLKYFQSYMSEHLLNGAAAVESASTHEPSVVGLVHVKKWIRTKHAIVFRLSNNLIQINFFDHTKLIVNTPEGQATFIEQGPISNTYRLDDIAASSHRTAEDMINRLTYATDVIEHMLQPEKTSTK
eukprot:m.329 g.329  ORF g.329 m.329 type:complete len:619 (+) comp118_c0_seq1:411-2267(+)